MPAFKRPKNPNPIAKRLLRLMDQGGLSISDLISEFGCSYTALEYWFQGKRNMGGTTLKLLSHLELRYLGESFESKKQKAA